MLRKIQPILALVVLLVLVVQTGCGDSQPKPRRSRSTDSSDAPAATTDNGSDSESSTPDSGETASTAPAEGDWGDLTARFMFVGTAPEPQKVVVNKDIQVCSKHHPVDESVVVGEGGELANVVVFVRDKDVKIHPDLQETSGEVVVDNKFCRFEPHIGLFRVGQKLVLKNSDTVGHNTKGDCLANPPFNLLIPPGESVDSVGGQLTKAERLPTAIGCNIHPWMAGYLIIRDNPYMAASSSDGTIEIKNLPTGELELQFWHEKVGYLNDIELDGKKTKKGRIKLAIKPGSNSLGDIKLDASLFAN